MSELVFQGVELVNANGDRVQGEDAVRDKALALYFSAEWCPYCQEFQPELNKFYEAANAEKPQLEIVFVSSDNSEKDHLAYFKKHGPWWTIPFDNELRNDLKRKYLVAARKEQEQVGVPERLGGLPTLLIIKPNGDVIARDGVERVKEDGAKALEQWLRA